MCTGLESHPHMLHRPVSLTRDSPEELLWVSWLIQCGLRKLEHWLPAMILSRLSCGKGGWISRCENDVATLFRSQGTPLKREVRQDTIRNGAGAIVVRATPGVTGHVGHFQYARCGASNVGGQEAWKTKVPVGDGESPCQKGSIWGVWRQVLSSIPRRNPG